LVNYIYAVDEKEIPSEEIKRIERGINDYDENLLTTEIPIFEKALTTSPKDYRNPYYLGLIYEGLMDIFDGKGKDDMAIEYAKKAVLYLEKSIELKGDFGDSFRALAATTGWLASTGAINGMRYGSRADTATEQAQKLDPDNPKVRILPAEKLLLAPRLFGGNRYKAVEVLEKLTKENPAYSDAWFRLGMANRSIGKNEMAKSSLQRALESNPKNLQARRILEEIRR
jgi:tetratricopeptide (TPR) repeat protein